MAQLVFTNGFVSVNGVDLSDHVTNVTIDIQSDEVDITAMSGEGWKTNTGGLKSWSAQFTFQQDFAAGKVDATIWPLLGTSTEVVLKPVNGGTTSTNPEYSGNVLVNAYSPIANGVGELATVQVTWPGSGALSRATS
jgi:hypothetical protein